MNTRRISEAGDRATDYAVSRVTNGVESRAAGETGNHAVVKADETGNHAVVKAEGHSEEVEELEETLACFSLFYLRPQPESWRWLEQQGTWQRFIGSIQHVLEGQTPSRRFFAGAPLRGELRGKPRGKLRGKPRGKPSAQPSRQPSRQPSAEASLSRWLREETGFSLAADKLSRAPRFETQRDFACRHLVGGLPVSVLPIESFYGNWTQQESVSLPFARQTGLYYGDAAAHMASLLRQFELTVTGEALLPPDHLTIELSFLGLLIRYGSDTDVCQFIDDHLSWL
ncbi:MAG: molecular chaperone TorD family protein, partial [Coriobacteriales bacterium]|nr:molecular chaperone TorD family protein [Coriobacteriales bacterium]